MTNCGKMRFVSMCILAALLGRSLGEDAGSGTVVVGNDSDGGMTVTQQGGDEPAPTMMAQDGVNPGSDASQQGGDESAPTMMAQDGVNPGSDASQEGGDEPESAIMVQDGVNPGSDAEGGDEPAPTMSAQDGVNPGSDEPAPAMSAQAGVGDDSPVAPTTVTNIFLVVGDDLPVAPTTVTNIQDGIALGLDETFLESVFILPDENGDFAEITTGSIFANDPNFLEFFFLEDSSTEDVTNDQGEVQEVTTRTVTVELIPTAPASTINCDPAAIPESNNAAPPMQPPRPSVPVVPPVMNNEAPLFPQQGIPSVGEVVVQIPFSLLFEEAMVETLAPTEEDRFRISNNLSARDAASRPSREANLFGNRDTDRSRLRGAEDVAIPPSKEENTGPGLRIFDRLSSGGVGSARLRGAVGGGGRGFLP